MDTETSTPRLISMSFGLCFFAYASIVIITTTRVCGVVMCLVAPASVSVCLSVCLYVYNAPALTCKFIFAMQLHLSEYLGQTGILCQNQGTAAKSVSMSPFRALNFKCFDLQT